MAMSLPARSPATLVTVPSPPPTMMRAKRREAMADFAVSSTSGPETIRISGRVSSCA